MELYQVKVVADVYADSNWDEIKKDMVIAFKDKDGKLTEKVPGKYESIKIISITNDRYKIKEEEGILRADQALEDMLSSETGWLVMDWDWVD